MPETLTIQQHHFRDSLEPAEARELFRTSVQYVELELFSYCNRKCWFCPNARIPQRQDRDGNQFMPVDLFRRIIGDLASVEYSGQIQFGRYNEPLSCLDTFLARLLVVRYHLPRAYLYMHTNGDFLTPQVLDQLHAAGLNELKVQTYLGNNQRYDETAMRNRQSQQLRRLGLGVRRSVIDAPGYRHMIDTDYPGMLVTLDARNFATIGTDRGGLVEIQQGRIRTAPCLIPFSQMYIDWNGSVMPCCNLRSDVPAHAPYAVANLGDGTSIFEAFVALHGWRKSLMRFGPKAAPCTTCRYDEHSVPESEAEGMERLYQLANSYR